jgi:glycosyltransferase involved in cell wall biosynthesis
MKLCLVTAFPPSRAGLNEYGFHLACELRQHPLLSLTILADELEAPSEELDGFDIIRCWSFNKLSNPVNLLRRIRDLKPDVVWFNLGFASFGDKPFPAFAGLAIPALARIKGVYTHVTLHQLMETVNLDDAGVRFPLLYKVAGSVATRIVLMSNSISVLMPAYRRTLREKYRGEYIHVRAHGIFSGTPEYPDFSRRNNPTQRILAFGKWGTYKRLEQLIDAFELVSQRMPDAKLIISGSNHPKAAGYVESIAAKYRGNPRIEFTGYVAEEKIPDLFGSATMVVMPYTSSAGASGVAHLAAEYGVPMITSNIRDFRDLAEHEGLAILFFDTGNTQELADRMVYLLERPELQRDMAEMNFSAALRMTMPQIIRQYLRSFDLHQRAKALEPLSRFRRLPHWVPRRSALARALSPRTVPWL